MSDSKATPGGSVYEWYRRGLDLLRSRNPAAAATLLERAVEAEPHSRSVREALARAQFDSGRYDEAAENFQRIVDASPVEDYARFGLGLAHSRAGRMDEAVGHLALAAAMRPELSHYRAALHHARATLEARR